MLTNVKQYFKVDSLFISWLSQGQIRFEACLFLFFFFYKKPHYFNKESEHFSVRSMYKAWHIRKGGNSRAPHLNCNFGLFTVAAPLSKCALLVWRVEVPTDCLDDGRIGMRSTISTMRWLIKCTKCFIVCSVLLLINYFSGTHCLKCKSYFKVLVWFYYEKLLLKLPDGKMRQKTRTI